MIIHHAIEHRLAIFALIFGYDRRDLTLGVRAKDMRCRNRLGILLHGWIFPMLSSGTRMTGVNRYWGRLDVQEYEAV
jgi:hypothetical protein